MHHSRRQILTQENYALGCCRLLTEPAFVQSSRVVYGADDQSEVNHDVDVIVVPHQILQVVGLPVPHESGSKLENEQQVQEDDGKEVGKDLVRSSRFWVTVALEEIVDIVAEPVVLHWDLGGIHG